MRSPGTEEVENPLPLPNKGCCRPCQPLLSALFLTRKLRWDRGGPWASTKALWNHAVTLRCPCRDLPCGCPQNLLPALGRLEPRPQAARQPPPCPLGRPGTRLFHEVGAEGQAGFPQPSAMQRCRFLLAAGQDGFFGACHYVWLSPRSAYNKREPETLPRARQTPAGRWGPRGRAGSTLPRGPVPFPSQAQTQTRASSPRDAEPDRRVGGCSTCIPSQAAALSRETKASFL